MFYISQSCSGINEQEKPNTEGWIVAEEAVVAQCEKPMPINLALSHDQ